MDKNKNKNFDDDVIDKRTLVELNRAVVDKVMMKSLLEGFSLSLRGKSEFVSRTLRSHVCTPPPHTEREANLLLIARKMVTRHASFGPFMNCQTHFLSLPVSTSLNNNLETPSNPVPMFLMMLMTPIPMAFGIQQC